VSPPPFSFPVFISDFFSCAMISPRILFTSMGRVRVIIFPYRPASTVLRPDLNNQSGFRSRYKTISMTSCSNDPRPRSYGHRDGYRPFHEGAHRYLHRFFWPSDQLVYNPGLLL
jgi:hypothetical protein